MDVANSQGDIPCSTFFCFMAVEGWLKPFLPSTLKGTVELGGGGIPTHG